MECKIRCWRIEDAEDIAETLNNKNILDNLRDGIPFPYTVHDAREFIQAMNAASCRILEKCGFELEGILRKNAVKNGVVVDMKMYSILKE